MAAVSSSIELPVRLDGGGVAKEDVLVIVHVRSPRMHERAGFGNTACGSNGKIKPAEESGPRSMRRVRPGPRPQPRIGETSGPATRRSAKNPGRTTK